MGNNTSIVGTAHRCRLRPLCLSVAMTLVLAACGQKGNLVLPTEAAAKDRATLPQTLLPGHGAASSPPATSAPLPAAPASAAR